MPGDGFLRKAGACDAAVCFTSESSEHSSGTVADRISWKMLVNKWRMWSGVCGTEAVELVVELVVEFDGRKELLLDAFPVSEPGAQKNGLA